MDMNMDIVSGDTNGITALLRSQQQSDADAHADADADSDAEDNSEEEESEVMNRILMKSHRLGNNLSQKKKMNSIGGANLELERILMEADDDDDQTKAKLLVVANDRFGMQTTIN